ncbi:hypothetical protein XMV201_003248 [Aliiroseovarius sp. xm-v-201]|nr:hypothetical protein [Aliiroseovarius sp. xm-m-314]NRP42837.1 hypothetical protein [Aliiroseovarius sp. xm-m-339-2]NRP45985.1 hypothetical protein [Aliiroseovarius sp. xm-m-378]NRP51460.1 hypothetical protein [Aliiroseovarius sp. xm-m-354]NRP63712.1 hypothetical protein [Aliiroseovarius sp. xm-a-151]NRP66853.1 hypothetical protein [Aliiroseovarius sp. xm-v-225]NRP81762.1 hypothetical protein [Aliiroseovarius sp. xm-v-209]NRP93917.1 hypothetical protein [Aliiroseovarius sp. xm-a-134]NRQ06
MPLSFQTTAFPRQGHLHSQHFDPFRPIMHAAIPVCFTCAGSMEKISSYKVNSTGLAKPCRSVGDTRNQGVGNLINEGPDTSALSVEDGMSDECG